MTPPHFPELDGTRAGSTPHAVALHHALQRVVGTLQGAELQRHMNAWTALRAEHLQQVPPQDRQLHAQMLTPVVAVGSVELSCLVLGLVVGAALLGVLTLLQVGVVTTIMLTGGLFLLVTLGLNGLIKASRKQAFAQITADAEQYLQRHAG